MKNLPTDTKKYVVLRYCVDQYAEGITGQNLYVTIYTNTGDGFRTKKEAKKEFRARRKEVKGVKRVNGLGKAYSFDIIRVEDVPNIPLRYSKHIEPKTLNETN